MARDEPSGPVQSLDVISIQTSCGSLIYLAARRLGPWCPQSAAHRIQESMRASRVDLSVRRAVWSYRGVLSQYFTVWGRDAGRSVGIEQGRTTHQDRFPRCDIGGHEMQTSRSVQSRAAGRCQVRALCSAGLNPLDCEYSLKTHRLEFCAGRASVAPIRTYAAGGLRDQ